MSLGCALLPISGLIINSNFSISYNPITRTDFTANIFDPIYGANDNPSVDDVHAHRLSIFFAVLATGALYDRHSSAKLLAQQYNVLSRAALSLDPISREANTATVQALNLSIRFLYVSDTKDNEERWLLGGICAKLAQIVTTSHFYRFSQLTQDFPRSDFVSDSIPLLCLKYSKM